MLARSVTLNILGQVGGLAIGFAASVVLARWLGPSDRGLLAVMLTVMALSASFASLGLPWAIEYYASRRAALGATLLGNTLAYAALLAALFVPAGWLLRHPLADLVARGRGGGIWILAAALVPVMFLSNMTTSQLSGALRFTAFNAVTVASRIVYLAAVLTAVVVAGLKVTGGLIATGVTLVVLALASVAAMGRIGLPRIDLGLLRRMLRFGLRAQVGTFFETLNYRLDVLILQFFVPLSKVGYYVVAQMIAELVVIIGRSFLVSVFPLIAFYEGRTEQTTTTVDAHRHHTVLALAAVLGNAVFGPLVILYGYGPAFHEAVVPMLILLPGMWFLGTATVIGGNLSGRGRPGLASALTGLTLVVMTGLDLALIPPFGVAGAAIASLVAYSFFGVISLFVLARVSGIGVRTLTVPTRADLALYRPKAWAGRVRPAAPWTSPPSE